MISFVVPSTKPEEKLPIKKLWIELIFEHQIAENFRQISITDWKKISDSIVRFTEIHLNLANLWLLTMILLFHVSLNQ
jgi:hypothetical protein